MPVYCWGFFKGVPEDGDLYILKPIIHNWADDLSVAILRNCRDAMEEDSKLVLVERVIGPPNQPSAAAIGDLRMFVVHSGRERRQEEFQALFAEAGLELAGVIDTGTSFAMVEARPAQANNLIAIGAVALCPLLAMCGRPLIGKGFREGDAGWSGAAMCPAC